MPKITMEPPATLGSIDFFNAKRGNESKITSRIEFGRMNFTRYDSYTIKLFLNAVSRFAERVDGKETIIETMTNEKEMLVIKIKGKREVEVEFPNEPSFILGYVSEARKLVEQMQGKYKNKIEINFIKKTMTLDYSDSKKIKDPFAFPQSQ